MLTAIQTMINTTQASSQRARSTLVKALFLKRLKKRLATDPRSVLDQLESLRKAMCSPQNSRILVIADLERLSHPVTAWQPFVADLDTSSPLNPLDRCINGFSEKGRHPGNSAYLVSLPTIDSSYSIHTARGPTSYSDPRLPALLVALAYFEAVEGPFWTAVRGTGLAYGVSFHRDLEAGHLDFRIYRSPDALKAFLGARQVLDDHLPDADGKSNTTFSPPALEGAISAIVVSFADEQQNMAQAAEMNFRNQVVREVPTHYVAEMLRRVREVGVPDLVAVVRDLLRPVFDPKTSNVVITCAPVLEEGLKKGFEGEGFEVERRALAGFQDDYGWSATEGEDGDEEEEDEEGSGDDSAEDDDSEDE